MPAPNDKDFRLMAKLAQISQIGLEMAIPVVIGVGVDYWLNTLPWFTIVGALVGPAVGFIHLLALLKPGETSKTTDSREMDQQP